MPICPECGHDNPDGARFCSACAARLGAEAPPGIRKTVTVLFCDLVGSTALGERADPELLRDLMARYHAELRAILERHGGTVEKFVGDAAMAVFGIPRVHEDDALRAVRAADEIQGAIERLGLEVRIGLNTGEVFVGGGETLVVGDAVNVAARLEQAAKPGEILIGEGTHALVRDVVQAEAVEPLALKGKAEPVPAYRLLEVLADAPAFTLPLDAPFVGREDELDALERTLARAITERSPQLATIVGPPGIGKSRLARELIQSSRARVLVGRCISYGEGITYWPLAEVLSQVGDVRTALEHDDEAELVAARIAAAVDPTATAAVPDEIAWGFRKLFETIARERPLIVVIDDIHWAEPTLLDLIEYVGTFARDAPLLLLCTARPDLFELRSAWASREPGATLVTLEPLAAAETETLIDELRDVPDETKARIVEAAEGNPLFVEQFLAMRAESDDGELEVPPTIQALLAARIDRLDPGERSVVERASVEGRMFHRGSVAELLPDDARAGVGGHLLTLVRKEFIRPDRATIRGDDAFRFAHVLIRDAAYDSIPKKLRAELHERFVRRLETHGDDVPDEILAYHLEQAYRYRIELGQDDEQARSLALRAGQLLAQAARAAHMRDDAAATRSLLERAIPLFPERDPDLPALLELLGSATFEAGDLRAAREILRRSQSEAAAAGQRGIELRARLSELSLVTFAEPNQESEAVRAEAEAAIVELSALDDAEGLVNAWAVLADVAAIRSDFALLETCVRRRFEIARRAGLHRDAVGAASWLPLPLSMGPTPVDEAIHEVEQLLVDFPVERPGEFHLALLYAFAGRDEKATESIRRARNALFELGQVMLHATMAMNVGWIALLAGDPERAELDLREAAEVLAAGGETGTLSTVAAVLAEVLYELDRDEEAEEWTRRSERATSPEDVLSQALWRATRAKLLARRGETEDALRLSAEAIEWIRRSDDLPNLGDCLVARAEVLQLLGRPDEARPVLEEALDVYERKGIVPSIEKTRGLLETTRSG